MKRFLFISWKFFITKTMRSGDGNNCLKMYAMLDHAPFKDVKVKSMSAPWINNTIRHKMNRRYKLFKEANRTKDPSKWAAYKKLRNEITADIRRAKAKHFKDLLADVKTTAEYWNLLSKANNPKLRKAIGPLKREDGSLAVDDKEK